MSSKLSLSLALLLETEPKKMYDVVLIIDGVSLKGLYDHSFLCRLNYDRKILMYVYNNEE